MWKTPAAFPQDRVLARRGAARGESVTLVRTGATSGHAHTHTHAGVISPDVTSPGSEAPGGNISLFRAEELRSTFKLWRPV